MSKDTDAATFKQMQDKLDFCRNDLIKLQNHRYVRFGKWAQHRILSLIFMVRRLRRLIGWT